MKRKLICMLLACTVGVSLASCGSQSQSNINSADFASFQKVQKNMKGIQDAAFKINFTNGVSGEGVSGGGSDEQSVKGKEVKNVDSAMDMQIQAKDSGFPGLTLNTYKKDNIWYQSENDGTKIKFRDTPAGTAGTSADLMKAQNLLNISRNMITSLNLSKEGNDTVYTFTLAQDSNGLEYMKQSVINVNDDIQIAVAPGKLKKAVPKLKVTIVAGADGMVKSMSLAGTVVVVDNYTPDQPVNLNYTLSMNYTSINTGLKINFPAFNGYIDYTKD